jgi:hypothetical protein
MRHVLILSAALTLSVSAAALAQAPSPRADVTVAIGPDLQKKAKDFGVRDLADLRSDLQRQVQHSMDHTRGAAPVKVALVIEDAIPNRPTFEQLGRTVGLSMRSVGLGGARVSGLVTYADGATRPVRVQYYETDLRNERGVGVWSDAYIAFDRVAYDLSHGAIPARYHGPGPSGSGHFGAPFSSD